MTYPPSLLTIGTCNRRAGIVAVVESFLAHHPDGRAFICLVDRPRASIPPLTLPGEVFFADELPLPGGRRFLFKYEAFELCCALKPYALRYVMEKFGAANVVYLDSDVLVTDSFWDNLERAWESHPVLLTPHLSQLPVELAAEDQRSLLQH